MTAIDPNRPTQDPNRPTQDPNRPTQDPNRPTQDPNRPVQVQPRTYDRPEARETKPSPMTTEFWAMLVGVVALVVTYNVAEDGSLDLFRTSLLATILAVGYIVSRGFAKSGSTDVTHNDRA